MKRGTVFRRPDEDEDDYGSGSRTVRAKPISEKLARKLGHLGAGKDFVVGSQLSHLSGSADCQPSSSAEETSSGVLSTDERNKIEAKILKAEMKGNTELVEKLKRKLEGSQPEAASSGDSKVRVLLKTDKRTGLTVPVSKDSARLLATKTEDGKYNLGTVESTYHTKQSVREMAAGERATTAEEQIAMFHRAAKTAERKTDDDWVVDDQILSHKRRRRHHEKDERKRDAKAVRENKAEERRLDSCKRCVDSSRLAKHCVVALGLKTYLTSTPWRPLVEGHCLIVPTAHYSCTVALDEDVYDEMRIWRKGLVAMWKAEDMDCVFVEMASDVKSRGHMAVECIPIPDEVGEMAPIYFKKAIDECESEWADNKKLIDLSKKGGDIRKAIPKGFSYFAVDFGLQAGYAHVIEDETSFPKNFAHEIIGGMLDLEPNVWRKREKLSSDLQVANTTRLKQQWAPFDWTEKVKSSISAK